MDPEVHTDSAHQEREADRGKRLWGPLLVLGALLAIYALSIAFRAPYLDRSMGLHHDETTARVLVHSKVWWEDGPSQGGYIMRRTLMNSGDKHISGAAHDDGNVYYYSFPPGHPLMAFAVHRAIGLEPTVMSVRVFNLILGFMCAAMIYLIVRELLRRLPDLWSRFAGIVAFTVYVFAPVALWYHSNAYSSSSAVQVFFIAALLAATYAYRPALRRPWLVPALFGAAVFSMCYTEWLGVAFAAVLVILWLLRRDDAVLRRLAITGAVGAVLAVALVAIQYSISLGVVEMLSTAADRYLIRSGYAPGGGGYALWRFESWDRFFSVYAISVFPLAVGALGLWAWDRYAGRGKARGFRAGDAPVGRILALSIVPVLVHHLVLFDHTVVHDFNMLKTTVFLSLVSGVLAGRLVARYAGVGEGLRARTPAIVLSLLMLGVVAGSLWIFEYINGDAHDAPEKLSAEIARLVQPDEVVFLDASAYVPHNMVTYYSGRNYANWPANPPMVSNLLAAGGDRTGVLLILDEYLQVKGVGYVGADGMVYQSRDAAKSTLPTQQSEHVD